MKGNERINKFLELQNKNLKFEEIAIEIGVKPKTLRTFLNRNGYKLYDGKYNFQVINDVNQIEFIDTKKQPNKNKIYKETIKKEVVKKQTKTISKSIKTKTKPKKDKKINITTEDMDKLCEVYDWYLQVKDYKSLKIKKAVNKKDINIENNEMKNLKSASIKVEKETWDEFERLCANSKFNKQEILTQALKDFMKEYKHLL